MFNLTWPWLLIIIGLLLLFASRFQQVTFSARQAFPTEAFARVVVTLAVLGSALYIILSGGYPEAEQKWAFGAVGTVLGFWLKK